MEKTNSVPNDVLNDERMSSQEVEILEVKPNNWQLLRYLKIKSVKQEPLAFEDQESGLEKYQQRSEKEWKNSLEFKKSKRVSFFARSEVGFIGMAQAQVYGEYAYIRHVWVDKDARCRGVGRKMIKTLIEHLVEEHHVKTAQLSVLITQKPAVVLYERLGFRVVEILQHSAKRGDRFYSKYKMELELN